jgi:hypothetical protein
MKRKMFLITISLLFFVAALFGQTSQVQPGVKTGTSFPAYTGSWDKLHFNQPATLLPEPAYSLHGGSASKTKRPYLDAAILAQNRFGNALPLQSGPQVGFTTTAMIKDGAGKVSLKDNLKKFDLSQPFGPDYFMLKNQDAPKKVWPADLFSSLH